MYSAKLVIAYTEEEEQACIILLALRLCVMHKGIFQRWVSSPVDTRPSWPMGPELRDTAMRTVIEDLDQKACVPYGPSSKDLEPIWLLIVAAS